MTSLWIREDKCLRKQWEKAIAKPVWMDRGDLIYRADETQPHKAIDQDECRQRTLVVRTDHYPFLWMWFWFWVRMGESLTLASAFVGYLICVWTDTTIELGSHVRARDVVARLMKR